VEILSPGAIAPVPEVLEAWTRGISITLVDDRQVPDTPGERRRTYAHRAPDGLDVGLALIRYGWAYARRDYTYERQPAYIAAEKEARDAGRGYWAKQAPAAAELVRTPGASSALARPATPSPAKGQIATSGSSASMSDEYRTALQSTLHRRRTKKYAPQPSGGDVGAPTLGLPLFGGPMGSGSVFVNGYFRSNGTYVQPYFRSRPGMGGN
jgi:hypothetical protein